ncbi:uncharacterized protein N7511_011294 [Penicillium nucicola]|uniref:uncharacterized protein n=1 Tax=Penicillium nucicola TaxID=1850975 RepID=UPI002545761F|nr:uncharacterized protein N7511_011294 [Penicillium nucicola]KAJ5742562.1 hypothetical protein N7511_011294 [Penicillium nucicola]
MTQSMRSDRLARYFGAVLHGTQKVQDLSSFKRLIAAILDQKDPCGTFEQLILSPSALSALRIGLRFNLTPAFINGYTAKFILHFICWTPNGESRLF